MKIDQAKIMPLGFSKTEIYAEYSGVRSLPASIEIIFTWAWFWRVFCIMLGYLFLALFLLFFVFYLMIKYKVKKIRELKASPREFITAAYHNLQKVMEVFAFSVQSGHAPLIFARLSEEKFAIKGGAFLGLTEKFEEARYSRNSLSLEDVKFAETCYNEVLNDILANYGKVYLLFKYLQALVKMTPFSLKNAKY
jgi:predicted membrane protein